MSNDLEIKGPSTLSGYDPIKEAQERIALVKRLLTTVLVEDSDYGIIPGCKQPTLLKAGAEQILKLFRLTYSMQITKESNEWHTIYTCKCVVRQGGEEVAEYVATANSNEEKWAWRKAYKQDFDQANPLMRREKWFTPKGGAAYVTYQIKVSPDEIDFQLLAMAQKRALVGATRIASACSGLFMDYEEGHEAAQTAKAAEAPIKQPTATQAEAPEAKVDHVRAAFEEQALTHITKMEHDAYIALLNGMGYANLQAVPPGKFGAVIKKLAEASK